MEAEKASSKRSYFPRKRPSRVPWEFGFLLQTGRALIALLSRRAREALFVQSKPRQKVSFSEGYSTSTTELSFWIESWPITGLETGCLLWQVVFCGRRKVTGQLALLLRRGSQPAASPVSLARLRCHQWSRGHGQTTALNVFCWEILRK